MSPANTDKIPIHILMVEDCAEDAELVLYELRKGGLSPQWCCVDSESDYQAHLRDGWDIILSD